VSAPHDEAFRRRAPRSRASRGAIAALVFLALATLLVAFVLPNYVAAPVPPLRLSSPAPAPAPAPAVIETARSDAERLLAEALRRVAKLEGEGARIWGGVVLDGVSFAIAEERLANANSVYDRNRHADALPLFREAIADLDRLAESKTERFHFAMIAGQQAFDARNAAEARMQFEIAVALAPGDAAATRFLERARTLPDVISNMARGQTSETAGDLAAAREAYSAAATLDPEFSPARENLARVEGHIAADEYRAAVSEAHARLTEGNLRGAQAALDRARGLDPNAPELNDLRRRLQASVRMAGLERLRTQAIELERQEKWPEAVAVYDRALTIDANAAFATAGRARAQRLADTHAALDQYIAEPTRLQSAEPRTHAKTLVAQAGGEDGPALSAKRRQLAELIAAMETPQTVILISDRSTEVTLQRIGKLGTFDRRRIDLPPGKYVAIGSRAGYRDVRVPFEVPQSEPIVVEAMEPIR
jgi:tetratricopeptide (TPR) repeat protein